MKTTPPKFGGAKAPPDGGRFARALGAFMMNCGVIEYHSYSWLMVLTPGFGLPAGVGDMSLSDRMAWIRRTLKGRKMTNSLRIEVFQVWDEVRRLSELRNVVAHGPMLWGDNENGTLMGIVPNVKKALKGKPAMMVEYDDIADAITQSAAVYPRLEALLNRLGEDMGIQVPIADAETPPG